MTVGDLVKQIRKKFNIADNIVLDIQATLSGSRFTSDVALHTLNDVGILISDTFTVLPKKRGGSLC